MRAQAQKTVPDCITAQGFPRHLDVRSSVYLLFVQFCHLRAGTGYLTMINEFSPRDLFSAWDLTQSLEDISELGR